MAEDGETHHRFRETRSLNHTTDRPGCPARRFAQLALRARFFAADVGVSPDVIRHTRCQAARVAQSARVLVVDDHDSFRRLARRMLESAGFTVDEAATGAAAIQAARATGPCLILLDIQLPDLDGFAVAEGIAAQDPSPVIVLTSTREASDFGDRIALSPAAGFIPKDQLSAGALRTYLAASNPP
jgi:CheY-like chemotaxis protein